MTAAAPGPERRALIIGATGQDGAYLARRLLGAGWDVHGTSRSGDAGDRSGLLALGVDRAVTLHVLDPADGAAATSLLNRLRPQRVFHLAAQSSVGASFAAPAEAIIGGAAGATAILEAARIALPSARVIYAGSAECFGETPVDGADETTPFRPITPYGVGKAAACLAVSAYRAAFGLWACSALLFNHESPLRPERFVTQRVVRGAVDIAMGAGGTLRLGPTSMMRDWGWAEEHVDAMARMAEMDKPIDLVIATGRAAPLSAFVACVFAELGRDWRDHVVLDPGLARPVDVRISRGRPDLAEQTLGWRAEVELATIAQRLVAAERARRET